MQRYGGGSGENTEGTDSTPIDIGGEREQEDEQISNTEDGGQGNTAGGRKRDSGPEPETPEERASDKLLDKETRKDEHEEVAQDPESFTMKMAKNKNLDQPNGEIN